MIPHADKLPLSRVLLDLAADEGRTVISIAHLLTALGDRAIGALLLIFALPNVLPTPPGISAILGAPLIFLAAQLAFGLQPWLPRLVRDRSITRADFHRLVLRIAPLLERAEKLLRPRATRLAMPPMEYAIGLICLLLALILVLPIPLGNTLPALSISVLALGVLERDGYWVLIGIMVAAVSVLVVSGIVFAMVKAAVFFLGAALT